MILPENVKNPNKPQFILVDVKNTIKRMETEQSLYAQAIKLRRKYLLFDTADKIKLNQNLNFNVNLKDHNYGLILI